MSDTTIPGPADVWYHHCHRCGQPVFSTGHTCPPGVYDQPAPQFPAGWPTPDYSAVLERIAAAMEKLAAKSEAVGPHQITEAQFAESGVVSHTREPGFPCWFDGQTYHNTARHAYDAAMKRKKEFKEWVNRKR